MRFSIPRTRKAQQRWLEVLVAVVISVAGLGTSWSAYQSALWSGVQSIHFGRASVYRVTASRAALAGETTRAWEVGMLSAWVQAEARGDGRLAGFYEKRFPPNLQPAFQAWAAQKPLDNPKAAPSPFRLPSYQSPGLAEANALDGRAEQEFLEGLRANRNSDAFTRGTVVLALSMFFGGILQVFRGRGVRMGLAAVAIIACLWGLERVLSLPTLRLAPPV